MRRLSCLLALVLAACQPRLGSPAVEVLPLLDPAPLGTVDGVAFVEGGVSGLDVDGDQLIAVTDRGPNADAVNAAGRPAKRFPLPGYHPALLRLAVGGSGVRVAERVPFVSPSGAVSSGLPVPAASGAEVVESAFDADGEALASDAWGIDAEGVAATEGGYWVSEEYRPSLWRVDRQGNVLERFTPRPVEPTDRPLPAVVLDRQANRGFEGVGVWPSGRIVAALQSPLVVAGGEGTRLARLVILDPDSGDAWTVAYEMDGPLRKIGDLAALDDGRLLVIEHGPLDLAGPWSGQVYLLDTRRADRLDRQLPEAGDAVRLAEKSLVLDLGASGWPTGLEKPEGLAVLDGRTLLVVNDNDYGLDSPLGDGQFVATGQQTVLVRFRLAEPLPGR